MEYERMQARRGQVLDMPSLVHGQRGSCMIRSVIEIVRCTGKTCHPGKMLQAMPDDIACTM